MSFTEQQTAEIAGSALAASDALCSLNKRYHRAMQRLARGDLSGMQSLNRLRVYLQSMVTEIDASESRERKQRAASPEAASNDAA
jgi:hypothetical protein